MSIYLGNTPLCGRIESGQLNNPFFFGMSQYFESAPNNVSWLISNNTYHSGITYASFYEWLLKIKNGTLSVDSVSVKAFGASDITDYDYVINTADTTFRLPLLDGSESLPSDRYEDLTYISDKSYTAPANGWFSCYGSSTAASASSYNLLINQTSGERDTKYSVTSDTRLDVSLEVSKGQSVYALSTNLTVEDFRFIYAKGNGSLYFYVGETIQDANVINAAGVLTRVADLSDSYISGLGMPSSRYIDLTLGASGSTYTAPANGWMYLQKKAGDTAYIHMYRDAYYYGIFKRTTVSADNLDCLLPCRKEDVITIKYSAKGTTQLFRFYYAEGEN